jgi:hypothetical protein
MGLVLLLIAMCSPVGHWMPAIVNSIIVSLALALIARGLHSAAFIKARKFVVTALLRSR